MENKRVYRIAVWQDHGEEKYYIICYSPSKDCWQLVYTADTEKEAREFIDCKIHQPTA